jgi:methylmalonyl-CoA/ethylmalonyl-CoA epimerase
VTDRSEKADEPLAVVEADFFGSGARLHHVGLAVDSIRAAAPLARPIENPTERVLMAFVRLHDVTLELLEPLGDDSPIARSRAGGQKLLHLCFEVPELAAALEHCRSHGFHRISKPTRIPEFEDRRVVWVHHGDYGLFELVDQ